jgi:hypothetical protein
MLGHQVETHVRVTAPGKGAKVIVGVGLNRAVAELKHVLGLIGGCQGVAVRAYRPLEDSLDPGRRVKRAVLDIVLVRDIDVNDGVPVDVHVMAWTDPGVVERERAVDCLLSVLDPQLLIVGDAEAGTEA